MILNIGDVIEIKNRQATVCYENTYQGARYICVFFSGENPQYSVYKYKEENNKLLVSQVEDEEELIEIMKIFIKEGVDESGIPEELDSILDYIQKHQEDQ